MQSAGSLSLQGLHDTQHPSLCCRLLLASGLHLCLATLLLLCSNRGLQVWKHVWKHVWTGVEARLETGVEIGMKLVLYMRAGDCKIGAGCLQ